MTWTITEVPKCVEERADQRVTEVHNRVEKEERFEDAPRRVKERVAEVRKKREHDEKRVAEPVEERVVEHVEDEGRLAKVAKHVEQEERVEDVSKDANAATKRPDGRNVKQGAVAARAAQGPYMKWKRFPNSCEYQTMTVKQRTRQLAAYKKEYEAARAEEKRAKKSSKLSAMKQKKVQKEK